MSDLNAKRQPTLLESITNSVKAVARDMRTTIWIRARLMRKTRLKKRPAPPPVVKPETLTALADGITDRRDKAIVLLLMETGLRNSELVRLDKDSIKTEPCQQPDGTVQAVGVGTIYQHKSPRHRQFRITEKTAGAIEKYLNEDRVVDDSPALFTAPRGERMNSHQVTVMIRRWCQRLGIKPFAGHEFRRSSIHSLLQRPGCDAAAVAHAMGYPSVERLLLLFPKAQEK